MVRTNNLKVIGLTPLIAPADLKQVLPLSETAAGIVAGAREQIQDILWGRDPRMMVVVGPCSIHDPKAALEYAELLAKLNDELKDQLLLVMRVYFEKPRTTVGWKGLINDPDCVQGDAWLVDTSLRATSEILAPASPSGIAKNTRMFQAGV